MNGVTTQVGGIDTASGDVLWQLRLD